MLSRDPAPDRPVGHLLGRSQPVPLGVAIGTFAAVSYGVVVLAALSLPETRGKELEAR